MKTETLVNWWLEKYHNTNLDKIKKENPEWEKDPEKYSRDFREKYAVTQQQHDEWEEWAKEYCRKKLRLTKRALIRGWWSIYLNTAPMIK